MNRFFLLSLFLALTLLLMGCTSAATTDGEAGSASADASLSDLTQEADSSRERYTGVLTARFTEGAGEDQAEVLTLETEDGAVYCTLLADSQGDLSAAVGDCVTAECAVVDSAPDYHPILTLTVVEQAAPAAGETAAWHTDALSLSVTLPEGWSWGFIADDTNDTTTVSPIAFWPEGVPELEVTLSLYPAGIGLCGTGVNVAEVALSGGLTATAYTEEVQGTTWFTLVYEDVDGLPEGASLVASCSAGAALWDEWEDEVLSVLSTVQYQGDFLPWREALAQAKSDYALVVGGGEPEDWAGAFDPDTGVWTVTFYEVAEDGDRSAVWSTQVALLTGG